MDWKAIISTVAPWIGTAINGPLGGMAVEAVANALGLTDKTVDAVKSAISGATPEQMLAIKQTDQNFALQMQQLGFQSLKDMEAIAVGDRANARNREVKSGDTRTPQLLAAFSVLSFIVLVLAVAVGVSPADGIKDAFLILLGAAIATYKDVYGYYFGSSCGSRENQAVLRDVAGSRKI